MKAQFEQWVMEAKDIMNKTPSFISDMFDICKNFAALYILYKFFGLIASIFEKVLH